MSANRRLVLWRHGRTAWNAEQRFQGQTDIALDEVGMEQARMAAQFLQHLTPDRIIASDLQRAAVTAQMLGDLVGLPVITDPDLRETFAGTWEGLVRAELMRDHAADFTRWAWDSHTRPGGGESRVEVAERMVRAIDRELAHVPEGGTLIIATHGGAARAAIASLRGLPPDHWSCLGVLSNCAWSVVREDATGWRLQEYNAGSLPQPALADDR
ncbi:MAG: histidine phosphatase family protein [Actinomycetota bacterium]